MKKERTLIITPNFYPENFIINDLISEWAKDGKKIEVLTSNPSYPFGKSFRDYKNKIYCKDYYKGIKVHRFLFIPGYKKSVIKKILNYAIFVMFTTLFCILKGRNYNQIFVYQVGAATCALAASIHGVLYKSRIILWVQDLWPDAIYRYGFKPNRILDVFLKGLLNFIYSNASEILVSSPGFINRIKQYLRKNRDIQFIANWSLVEYKPTGQIKLPGVFNFTFAGNIGKMRSLDTILLGFNLFVKRYPQTYLNIIGDGSYLEEVHKIIHKHNIPNVFTPGRKPITEMSDYFYASDILILSLAGNEVTIPSKLQAYLSTGKPIFGVINGVIGEMNKQFGFGVTADPKRVDDIAKGFEKLVLLNDSEKELIRDNSRKLLALEFDKKILITKLNGIVYS